MKLTIKANVLLKELQFCSLVVNKRSIAPIFGCILFEINNNVLSLYGTNMETTNKSKLNVECVGNFNFAADSTIISNIVRNFIGDVSIELCDDCKSVVISDGSSKYSIPVYDVVDFFKPSINVTDTFTIESDGFIKSIKLAQISSSNDPLMINQCGVHVKSEYGEIAGLDKSSFTIVKCNNIPKDMFIQKQNIQAISALGNSGQITISTGDKYDVYSLENRSVALIQSNVSPMEYNKYIPTNSNIILELDRVELTNKITKLSNANLQPIFIVVMEVADGIMKLKIEDLNFNISGEEVMEVSHGISFTKKMNGKLLLNLLNIRECDILHINTREEPNSPVMIDGNDNIKNLLMPIV